MAYKRNIDVRSNLLMRVIQLISLYMYFMSVYYIAYTLMNVLYRWLVNMHMDIAGSRFSTVQKHLQLYLDDITTIGIAIAY